MNLLQIIDDMPGPAFLILYGVVIAVTLMACKFWAGWDATRNLPTPPVSKGFDPVEIAYLRAGENAVAHLIVFGLLQRGYLQMTETRKWLSTQRHLQQSDDPPDLKRLTPVETDVFGQFTSPLSAAEVLRSLPGVVAKYCGEYQQRCVENQLLATSGIHGSSLIAGSIGAFVILGLGGFKLWDALAEHRTNIRFLVGMAFVAMLLLAKVCRKNRQTNLGKRYLARLKEDVDARGENPAKADPVTGVVYLPDDPSRSDVFVALGVLGTSALAGTGYAHFHDMFRKAGGGVAGGGCGGGCGGGGGGGGCGGG